MSGLFRNDRSPVKGHAQAAAERSEDRASMSAAGAALDRGTLNTLLAMPGEQPHPRRTPSGERLHYLT